ncbi:TonB-dependent receptor [Chromobacterium subtsugae]|uniref:TonB-dependent receptor n=1 Tax=Chromobacterium subtsugae TaxID=251747 RepID=UPI00069A938F|nr:TonB-dependent receptor [Chromobacterium subtsugae]
MFKFQSCALFAALTAAGVVQAADLPEFAGDPVIVTASRVPQKVSSLPANVTVITAEDIANSTATTVQDVLSSYAGVHVSNSSGSASTAMVDLRGFGVTGMSNTLVLVDGVRQNTNDLSAPNLGAVTLASIDHIEVVRGIGGVAYGGGATGGVINIITKSGAANGVNGSVMLTGGSYDLRQLDANLHAGNQYVALDGYVQSLKTDNYRQNNAERDDNAGATLTFKHDGGDIKLFAKTASQGLRLPGSIVMDPANGQNPLLNNPTGTATPNSHSSTGTSSGGVSLSQDLGAGTLYADWSRRVKDADSCVQYAGIAGCSRDQRNLGENAASARYELPIGKHTLSFGSDWLDSSMSVYNSLGNKQTSQKRVGYFVDGQFKLWQGATLSAGGRQQLVDDKVNAMSGGANLSTIHTSLHAWSLGLKQDLRAGWSVYARSGQSFRLGNADEVTYTNGLPLQPQQSHDREVGAQWANDAAHAKLALFRNDLTNEIAYNPFVGLFGANANLPETRHQGVELEGGAKLSQRVGVNANLTWTQATYRSGAGLAGNTIPMVPKLMANTAVNWSISDASKVSVAAQYVSQQYFDNDQSNAFGRKLPAYTVVDAKFSQAFGKHVSATFSVNNLFNRHYATYGGTDAYTSPTAYDLYPANARNYQAAVTYTF